MSVSKSDIGKVLVDLGINKKPVCVHSSLSSFGWIDGGAESIVQGFLNEECTLLVPTFADAFSVFPPEHLRPSQNGCGDYSWLTNDNSKEINNFYSSTSNEVDLEMGAIPKTILRLNNRLRGNHPLNSFTAIGSYAEELILKQAPLNVYAPLKAIAELGGYVVLMGVNFNRLTLIHLAEQMAGRNLFRRWAKDSEGLTIEVEVGGCSEGFIKLQDVLMPVTKKVKVGQSEWNVLDVNSMLEISENAIRNNPMITHCGDYRCDRCNDAVKGGPILA